MNQSHYHVQYLCILSLCAIHIDVQKVLKTQHAVALCGMLFYYNERGHCGLLEASLTYITRAVNMYSSAAENSPLQMHSLLLLFGKNYCPAVLGNCLAFFLKRSRGLFNSKEELKVEDWETDFATIVFFMGFVDSNVQ